MNISDLYSSRIQKTFDDDHAEIVKILKAAPKKVFKLINYYKGLPLSYPATINSIDRGIVDMDVQQEQAFTIERNHSTFIRSPLFKHDVFAQVQYVNIKKKAATFVKFSYVEIMAERRNFIRMEPEPSPDAVIESPRGIIKGNLYDVSLSGLNISVDEYYPIEINTEMSIRFRLRDIEERHDMKVNVPAKLVGIMDGSQPYHYKFIICPDKMLERNLSQYIFHRQIEIIKEIKDL
ncbi:MAG: PilZ domain-containing protein [Oryzomonas sp.]|uniref:PilZ domain-containing protein n=1 Tax=Oryzomonas sp. TaxID=2855186 RepID=UPI002845C6C2|nr:PilZ domain-containing protein [Oryzomonas sp.]MDR3580168.1 PilZ domain-containing protein [Oryzomonas sp.]